MPSILDTLLGREEYGPPMPGATMQQNRSIFDILAGGGGNAADPLDPATMRRAQFTDSLAGLSRGLLAAGGPSLMPMDFGSALGKGLSEGLAARDSGEDRYLKRALVGSQVATARDKMKQRQELNKLLLGANEPDPVAPATGAAGATTPPAGGAPSGSLPAEWDPHYHKASAATGMSVELLKAKDLVESGGNANAVSPAGATGPAQLMPGTAADLGVANSKDPAQAIDGGARYLKAQYDKYKNADIALMAYNWGPGNVDNWIRTGADPNKVPAETKGYLAKIHARLGTAPPTFAAAPMPGPPPGLVPNATMAQMPGPPAGLTPTGGPPMAPMPQVMGPNQIAQPPATLASAPGGASPAMPPQGDAAPAGGVQIAQAAPVQPPSPVPQAPTAGAPAAQTIKQVIQSLKPAERQLLATMDPEDVTKFLLTRASPNHETVLDTVDGTVKFVDKNDRLIGTRYQPVKAAELAISMRQAAAAESQAASRAKQADTGERNAPVGPDGRPQAAVSEAAGQTEAAKEKAKQKTAQDFAAANKITEQALTRYEKEVRPGALSAQKETENLYEMKRLLDQGVKAGVATEPRMFGNRVLDTLGLGDVPPEQINRVEFNNRAAQRVMQIMASHVLGSGTAVGEGDRRFVQEMAAAGGNFTDKELKRLIDVGVKATQGTLKAHQGEVDRMKKLPGAGAIDSGYFDITAPTFDEWNKANPPAAPSNAPSAPGTNLYDKYGLKPK